GEILGVDFYAVHTTNNAIKDNKFTSVTLLECEIENDQGSDEDTNKDNMIEAIFIGNHVDFIASPVLRDQICDSLDWLPINFNEEQIGKKTARFFIISIILVILVIGSIFWLFERHLFSKHSKATEGNTTHTINIKKTKDNTLSNSRKDNYIGGIVDKGINMLIS
ncbi:hypothetical protein CDIK_3207, partial [Cucumispora dikerogammari]